jgi:hypothetical protein
MYLAQSVVLSFLLVGLISTHTLVDAATLGLLRGRHISTSSTSSEEDRIGNPLGFYETRPDDRRCPAPLCGGVWLHPIDGSLITCPGASIPTAECYVGALLYQPLILGEPSLPSPSPSDETGISIVYGRFVPGNYPTAPDLYNFAVQDGTEAAKTQQIILEYSVKPDYRYCMSPLCGGYWLKALATTKTLCSDGTVADACYVANINLSRLGTMTPQEEQAVWEKVMSDGGWVKGYYIENSEYATAWPDMRDLYVMEANGPPSPS